MAEGLALEEFIWLIIISNTQLLDYRASFSNLPENLLCQAKSQNTFVGTFWPDAGQDEINLISLTWT